MGTILLIGNKAERNPGDHLSIVRSLALDHTTFRKTNSLVFDKLSPTIFRLIHRAEELLSRDLWVGLILLGHSM
jgi:hypothetical protein